MRPNHQYPRVSGVDLDFRNHADMIASRNSENRFIDLENERNEEIAKFHKTQISVYHRVPAKPDVDLNFRGHSNMVAL